MRPVQPKDYLLIFLVALGVALVYSFPAGRGDVGWWVPAALGAATFLAGVFVLRHPDNVYVQPLPIGFGIVLGLGLANLRAGLYWWIPLAAGALGYGAGLLMFMWRARSG